MQDYWKTWRLYLFSIFLICDLYFPPESMNTLKNGRLLTKKLRYIPLTVDGETGLRFVILVWHLPDIEGLGRGVRQQAEHQNDGVCRRQTIRMNVPVQKSWQKSARAKKGAVLSADISTGRSKWVDLFDPQVLLYGKIIKEVCGRTVALNAFG